VIFGPVANDGVAALRDINGREGFILGALALAVLLVGVWPAPLVNVLHTSVNDLLQHVVVSKL
jgi:NADH-quinone oxidoreductase subunit M